MKKVPGRMGMVITTCLISFNVYNAVDAPPRRGFSYIELWMIGMEIPIVLAILEYSAILGMKRWLGGKMKMSINIDQLIGRIDAITCIISIIYFIVFSSCYWLYKIIKFNK